MCKFSHVLYYVADDDLEDRNVKKNYVLKYYMSFLHYQVTTKKQTQWISIFLTTLQSRRPAHLPQLFQQFTEAGKTEA